MATVNLDIEYAMTGASDVRDRPTFEYDYPQQLYVVLE